MQLGYQGHGLQQIARSMSLITATRNAHIIVIFIKHRARARTGSSGASTTSTKREYNPRGRCSISDETLVIVNNRNRD